VTIPNANVSQVQAFGGTKCYPFLFNTAFDCPFNLDLFDDGIAVAIISLLYFSYLT
jgi:hypothetical protein